VKILTSAFLRKLFLAGGRLFFVAVIVKEKCIILRHSDYVSGFWRGGPFFSVIPDVRNGRPGIHSVHMD
jgi:hypothetical protein